MSLDTGRYQLFSSWQTLQERWEDTQRHWRDAIQKDFAENFWAPLDLNVRSTLVAIDRLGLVLARARQECS